MSKHAEHGQGLVVGSPEGSFGRRSCQRHWFWEACPLPQSYVLCRRTALRRGELRSWFFGHGICHRLAGALSRCRQQSASWPHSNKQLSSLPLRLWLRYRPTSIETKIHVCNSMRSRIRGGDWQEVIKDCLAMHADLERQSPSLHCRSWSACMAAARSPPFCGGWLWQKHPSPKTRR